MSTTITIRDNVKYLFQERPDEVVKDVCLHCGGLETVLSSGSKDLIEKCIICEGFGWVTDASLQPFALSVNRRVLLAILLSLGLPISTEGEVDPRWMLRSMDECSTELMKYLDGNRKITIGDAERYVDTLRKICQEAERREANIVWG